MYTHIHTSINMYIYIYIHTYTHISPPSQAAGSGTEGGAPRSAAHACEAPIIITTTNDNNNNNHHHHHHHHNNKTNIVILMLINDNNNNHNDDSTNSNDDNNDMYIYIYNDNTARLLLAGTLLEGLLRGLPQDGAGHGPLSPNIHTYVCMYI